MNVTEPLNVTGLLNITPGMPVSVVPEAVLAPVVHEAVPDDVPGLVPVVPEAVPGLVPVVPAAVPELAVLLIAPRVQKHGHRQVLSPLE